MGGGKDREQGRRHQKINWTEELRELGFLFHLKKFMSITCGPIVMSVGRYI